MKIKQIELNDLPDVYRLGTSAFIDEKGGESFVYNYWSLSQLAQMFEDYPELSFVAMVDDTLVGFVLGHPSYEGIVKMGYLEWVAVHPDYRGQGIAKQLVNHLLEKFKSRGQHSVVTDVKGVNTASMNLFKENFDFEEREQVSFLVKEL